jgi:hypothetical protein
MMMMMTTTTTPLTSLFTDCSSAPSPMIDKLYWEAIRLRISIAENFRSPTWNFKTIFPPVHALMLDDTERQMEGQT